MILQNRIALGVILEFKKGLKMPFPALLALGPPLIAWGTRAAATYGLARLFSEEPIQELKQMLVGFVVEQAATKAGLALDPDDPFSDASMAGAVGARIGVTVRSLKDQAMIREDLENYAVGLVSSRAGYEIRSVSDVAILREDLRRIGAALVAEKVGLPVGIIPENGDWEGDVVKERILQWAEAEVLSRASSRVTEEIAKIEALGDFEAVAGEINSRLAVIGSAQMVEARQVALMVANKLAVEAVADYGKVAAVVSKRSRRQELNRAAQAKFRAAHGNRQKYVPLGMSATIG